jgi:eukaryotic-like serine/threonine-protein kinase
MRPEQAERLAELVEHAFELEGAERATFLAQTCGDDVELRREVEALLGEQEHASKLMNAPAAEFGAKLFQQDEDAGELRPGEILGDYRIISLLGEGGMGEVYLADDTHFGRQVAIKLIKRGFGTKEFVRHFRQEERILAALNHPNIARLYGGAVTSNGLPYFVMEYVEGIPLETYAARHSFNLRERLALFRKVCAAVSYAHQNLVIHRDLKPANIRVTADGEPKLLDFGIARLLDPDTAQTDNLTMLAVRAMTPNYSSPEQLRGERMTTASDVYSLGVVLYELLTGQKPGLRKDGEADLKKLDADLDNIVFKSLRLEPERRYSSVGQFSEDIRRYLEGLPVRARKDTLGYRASKFVRRHKPGVAAAAVVMLALLGGLITTTRQMRIARQERDRAQVAQTKSEQARRQTELAKKQADRLNHFLEDLLSSADPAKMGKDVKVVQVLDAAGKSIDDELAKEPEVLAQVHETLSRAYERLKVIPPSEEHARKALGILRQLHGDEDLATAKAEFLLGSVLVGIYQLKEAEPLLRHALAVERRQIPPDTFLLAETLRILGRGLTDALRLDEGAPCLAESLALMRVARGEHSLEYVEVLYAQARAKHMETEVAAIQNRPADLEGAIAGYRRVIELFDQVSPNSTRTIAARTGLCICLWREQKLAEEEQELERLDQDCRQLLGDNNIFYMNSRILHTILDFGKRDYPKVVKEAREPLDYSVATLPANHRNVVQMRGLYGLALTRTSRAAEGEPFLRAAYKEGSKIERFSFEFTFGNLETALGECLFAQGRYAEAEPLLLTGYDDLKTRLGEKVPMTLAAARRLRELYIAWNKPTEANRFAEQQNPPTNSSR